MDAQALLPAPPTPPRADDSEDVENPFRSPSYSRWNSLMCSSRWDSERPFFSSNEPRHVGAALANLGNTCFLNSVLQCITHTVPLVQKLRLANHPSLCASNDGGFCALCTLKEHVECCLEHSGHIVLPANFANNLSKISSDFKLGMQEDAHEFLRCFLDRLHTCCLDPSFKDLPSSLEDDSLVKQVFGGQLRSQIRCCECGHSSNTFEPVLDLSLEIDDAESVKDALESFTRMEKIEDPETKFTCEGCKTQVAVEKQLKVDQAPSVLALHLKRFKHTGFFINKIGKFIQYPLELDLKPYLSCTDDKEQLKYDLYAVIVHMGSALSGHYYCHIRSSPTMWHDMDDDKVTKISELTVLNQTAYILFYIRQGSSPWFLRLMETQKIIPQEIENGPSPTSILDQIDRYSSSSIAETSSSSLRETTEKDEWLCPQAVVSPDMLVGKAPDKTETDHIPTSPRVSDFSCNDMVDRVSLERSVTDPSNIGVPGNVILDMFEDEPLEDEKKDDQLIPLGQPGKKSDKEVKKPALEAMKDPRVKESLRYLRHMPGSRRSGLISCLPLLHPQSLAHRSIGAKRRKVSFR